MANTSKKVQVVVQGAKMPKKVVITRDTTEAEVVRYQSEGAEMTFPVGEEFKELPDSVATVLSHENARRYWMAFGEQKARVRHTEKPLVEQIIDPLVGHEEARLSFRPDGTPASKEFFKKNWLAWEFCTTVDGFIQKGYRRVQGEGAKEEDPVVVGIPANASGYYLTKDTQGRDELMLLCCPMHLHDAHDRAVVAKSRQQVTGARAQFEGNMDKLGVKPMKENDEDRTVEKVRVNRETVDRAFLTDKK